MLHPCMIYSILLAVSLIQVITPNLLQCHNLQGHGAGVITDVRSQKDALKNALYTSVTLPGFRKLTIL